MTINTNYFSTAYNSSQALMKKDRPSIAGFIDQDNDKSLSAEELTSFSNDYAEKTGNSLDLSSIMSVYDTDGDGSLNESEQEAMSKERALEKLMAGNSGLLKMKLMENPSIFSSDGSDDENVWNSDEFAQFTSMFSGQSAGGLDIESLLAKYDADGDGSLNQSELAEMITNMAPPPQMRKDESSFSSALGETQSVASTSTKSVETETEKEDKTQELKRIMEEIMAKRTEERKLVENSLEEALLNKKAFMSSMIKSVNSYEKSFFFGNNAEVDSEYSA